MSEECRSPGRARWSPWKRRPKPLALLLAGLCSQPTLLAAAEPEDSEEHAELLEELEALERWEESTQSEATDPVDDPAGMAPAVEPTAQSGSDPAPADAPPKTAPPKPDPDEDIDEVLVVATRRPPERLSFRINREEIRILPGAFGDAFRAVGTLPGITPVISGAPFYYVRGSPPGNIGYRYDGIELPTLFHVGLGPSVLQPAFVDAVHLRAGSPAAQFGHFAGGFITADPIPPAFELRGEFNLRLFDAGAFVETPFADGKGTIALGGRYSYTAALLSLVAEDTVLDYHDYQARLTYELTPHDRLTAFFMGSYDVFGDNSADILEVNFGSEFQRLSLIHEHHGPNSLWRTQVTGGFDRSIFGFDNSTRRYLIGGRTRYEQKLNSAVSVRAGADANLTSISTVEPKYVDPEAPSFDFENTFASRTDTSAGTWVDATLRPTEALSLVPALRVGYYHSIDSTLLALEPRLKASYALTPSTALLAEVGLAHQPPSSAFPIGGLAPAGLDEGLQRTIATSLGVKSTPWSGARAGATVFYNQFSNMTDALALVDSFRPDTDINRRTDGNAYGLELSFQGRVTERITGLVSYTLSRSLRDADGQEVLSQFDRPHVLNTALNYDFGRGYQLGGRYLFYSGSPFAPEEGSNAAAGEDFQRGKGFYRIDVRMEKRWKVGSNGGWLALVLEGLNVTLSREELSPGELAPALAIPSIGLEGNF